MAEKKFYQWSQEARLHHVVKHGGLDLTQHQLLQQSTCQSLHQVNDACSENVIGAWPLPFAVVEHFPAPDGPCMLPMVIEETSVVAAMNYAVKTLRSHGSLHSTVSKTGLWGQVIYFQRLGKDFPVQVARHAERWIKQLNTHMAKNMYRRGGGVKAIRVRQDFADQPSANFTCVEVLVDTVDAMGANFVNQVAANLAQQIFSETQERADTVILSNHQPDDLVSATLSLHGLPESTCHAIEQLSQFAACDVYRAVTHNKGVMNGIDAVLLATGNDWRAASAAIYAYASQLGSYRPLSSWTSADGVLKGHLKIPIPCATVGGVSSAHPMARIALDLLGKPSKQHLMRICASAGLLQNFSALRALVEEGISQGHMRLHIKNYITALGVPENLRALVESDAKQHLKQYNSIQISDVHAIWQRHAICQTSMEE